MEKDINLAAPCGIYCGECRFFGARCTGCRYIKGKPFFTAIFNIDICPLYECPVLKKNLEHCGQCELFPCETFLSMRDPSMSDEQFKASVKKRKATLERRRETGTAAWLEEAFG